MCDVGGDFDGEVVNGDEMEGKGDGEVVNGDKMEEKGNGAVVNGVAEVKGDIEEENPMYGESQQTPETKKKTKEKEEKITQIERMFLQASISSSSALKYANLFVENNWVSSYRFCLLFCFTSLHIIYSIQHKTQYATYNIQHTTQHNTTQHTTTHKTHTKHTQNTHKTHTINKTQQNITNNR
jgi:hypothetical protein